MPTNKPHSPTAERSRRVIAGLAPQGIRRASAQATPQTEPVPAWTAPPVRSSRFRTRTLLLLGFILGLILIFLGMQVISFVNEVVAHWHGGDGYVAALDADVGHGGTSHFLAFYQNGDIIVIECSTDYSSTHSYTVQVAARGNDHHGVTLASQVIDGRHDLVIKLDNGVSSLLYNTGDSFSVLSPQ